MPHPIFGTYLHLKKWLFLWNSTLTEHPVFYLTVLMRALGTSGGPLDRLALDGMCALDTLSGCSWGQWVWGQRNQWGLRLSQSSGNLQYPRGLRVTAGGAAQGGPVCEDSGRSPPRKGPFTEVSLPFLHPASPVALTPISHITQLNPTPSRADITQDSNRCFHIAF